MDPQHPLAVRPRQDEHESMCTGFVEPVGRRRRSDRDADQPLGPLPGLDGPGRDADTGPLRELQVTDAGIRVGPRGSRISTARRASPFTVASSVSTKVVNSAPSSSS
nr:hypothetical protein [Haloarcula sp. CBA1128]